MPSGSITDTLHTKTNIQITSKCKEEARLFWKKETTVCEGFAVIINHLKPHNQLIFEKKSLQQKIQALLVLQWGEIGLKKVSKGCTLT